jgi:cytochrome c biogenesis protein CcmG, thiol:disulfide interchange protein DsbE
MQRWLNFFLVLAVAGVTWEVTIWMDHAKPHEALVADGTQAMQKAETDRLSEFSLLSIQGRRFSTSDFKGRIVLLNFWASWCPPCIKEFPDLLKIAAEYKDSVTLIAISSDHDEAAMQRFLDKMEESNPDIESANIVIARDPLGRVTQGLFQTFRLPETLIVDADQRPVRKLIGADWQADDLRSILDGLEKK